MLRGLRKTQIKEETKEFYDALDNQDALNAIQELCDILYVVYGAAVVMGVDLEPFFEAIHEANMKKVPGPKREDGKQLKPEGWVPADMKRTFIDTYNFWAPKS
jgi:predicted HAD superfamily Cof-like phosphohydrolase